MSTVVTHRLCVQQTHRAVLTNWRQSGSSQLLQTKWIELVLQILWHITVGDIALQKTFPKAIGLLIRSARLYLICHKHFWHKLVYYRNTDWLTNGTPTAYTMWLYWCISPGLCRIESHCLGLFSYLSFISRELNDYYEKKHTQSGKKKYVYSEM